MPWGVPWLVTALRTGGAYLHCLKVTALPLHVLLFALHSLCTLGL